jgi:hypothetical protein
LARVYVSEYAPERTQDRPFIRKHHIDMIQFEPGPYRTYAAFFDRRFKPGVRRFPEDSSMLGAFAEHATSDGREFGQIRNFQSRATQ